MLNYLISISNDDHRCDATIHDANSKLKVFAFDMLVAGSTPTKGEIRFFVTSGCQQLVFETKGFKGHRQLLVLQMISWYCLYLGLVQAQIHTALPMAG